MVRRVVACVIQAVDCYLLSEMTPFGKVASLCVYQPVLEPAMTIRVIRRWLCQADLRVIVILCGQGTSGLSKCVQRRDEWRNVPNIRRSLWFLLVHRTRRQRQRHLASHFIMTFLVSKHGWLEEELIFSQLFVLNNCVGLCWKHNIENRVLTNRCTRFFVWTLTKLFHESHGSKLIFLSHFLFKIDD